MGTNLAWRANLRDSAAVDTKLRADLLAACTQSPHFWINTFVWTYRQKVVLPDGSEKPVSGHAAHVPFITWPVQDEALTLLHDAILSGRSIDIEKSRDMGASWLILLSFLHSWQFRNSVNFLLLSRKEDYVDAPGNMDSLFEKLRYVLHWQPAWMTPRTRDRFMYLGNEERKNTITGESTNSDAGRGGRKTAAMVDEAAAIRNAEEIENALSQNTPCVIWNSTPRGPGTWFYQRIRDKRGTILRMPWWRHPDKGRGAREILDTETGKVRWTSPWYEKTRLTMSRKSLAQEVDMDHGQAGDLFFDLQDLERHRADHVCHPRARGEILWNDRMEDEKRASLLRRCDASTVSFRPHSGRSPWRIWVPLIDGRPPQTFTYCFGADISNGAGESNSVLTVLAAESNQIVAKYWDSFTSPEDFAAIAAAAGVWFGGQHGPAFVIWENNGPGGIFGRKLVKLGYPHYYKQRIDNSIQNRQTPRWGWHSNQQRKEVLLGMYRDALARNQIINPCSEALDEAGDYIYDDTGTLIPGRLRKEASGGRMLHGDHVIADALTVLGRAELPKWSVSRIKPPSGSFAARKALADRLRRERDVWAK